MFFADSIKSCFENEGEGGARVLPTKAMRKDFFSGFSDFAKDGTDFFPNSNIDSKKYSGFVLAKVSQNNAEVNAELEVRNHCTKIFKFICPIRK